MTCVSHLWVATRGSKDKVATCLLICQFDRVWSQLEDAPLERAVRPLARLPAYLERGLRKSGADAGSLPSTLVRASSLLLLSRLPSFDGLPIHTEGQHLSRNPPALQQQVSRHPIMWTEQPVFFSFLVYGQLLGC